jgi:hypothetical protein
MSTQAKVMQGTSEADEQLEAAKFDTKGAARFCGTTEHHMIRMRCSGRGPKHVRLARNVVRYRLRDLIEFLSQHSIDPTRTEGGTKESLIAINA